MAIEEDILALLEEGRLASLHTEDARQARYRSEDESRKLQRAAEDNLRDQGESVREAKKAEMESLIAARGMTLEARMAEQDDKIAKLQGMLDGHSADPVVVHAPDPAIPVV